MIDVDTGKGSRAVRVVIEDIKTDECPKSLLLRSTESADLIQIFNQSQNFRSALGPASRWSGAFYDALSVIMRQQEVDKQACRKAIHSS